jgi:hypothetical protein
MYRPRPLDPPVMTAILLSREKMDMRATYAVISDKEILRKKNLLV